MEVIFMIVCNNGISYDFNSRMFDFISTHNNNIAQYYLMSNKQKEDILKKLKPKLEKVSSNLFIAKVI